MHSCDMGYAGTCTKEECPNFFLEKLSHYEAKSKTHPPLNVMDCIKIFNPQY